MLASGIAMGVCVPRGGSPAGIGGRVPGARVVAKGVVCATVWLAGAGCRLGAAVVVFGGAGWVLVV